MRRTLETVTTVGTWLCLVVAAGLTISVWLGDWAHGDEGIVYPRLFLAALSIVVGFLLALAAIFLKQRSAWIPLTIFVAAILWVLVLVA